MSGFVQKVFLARRRWDPRLAWLGGAGLPLRNGITSFAAIVFALIGLYLVAFQHRSTRLGPRIFLVFALCYAAWSLTLVAFRAEPFIGNRQVTYSLMIGLLAFVANGMVLVRDPLRSFVIGARVGTVIVAGMAVSFGLNELERFGVGGNPAPFAMVAGIAMITAIVPIPDAPRWAPNSILYVLIGSLPIMASQTRAVLVVVPVVLLVEALLWLQRRTPRIRMLGYAGGILALVLAVSFGPIHTTIFERFVPIVHYLIDENAAWAGGASVDLRYAMWEGAARAIAESPIVGHGSDGMARVVELAPLFKDELALMEHVHNFALDELLQHGAVGLVLLCGTILAGAGHVLRHARQAALQRNLLYALMTLGVYGMLHNPLLHETTISAFFFYLGVLIAHISRRRMDARLGRPDYFLSKK